jgi:RimJ/RimL family protein N-acetyltransferase
LIATGAHRILHAIHEGDDMMADELFAGRAPAYSVRTKRLTIRCWSASDAPEIKRAIDASLDHLRPWMPWAHNEPSTLADMASRLERFRANFVAGSDWVYGILDAGETRVIGGSGLHPRIGRDALEIGYWISADAVGNGFATETSAALTRVGFEISGVDRMEIRCDPGNAASAAIPARLGYRFDRTIVGNMTDHEGKARDTMVWVLTRDDYPASISASLAIEARDIDGGELL